MRDTYPRGEERGEIIELPRETTTLVTRKKSRTKKAHVIRILLESCNRFSLPSLSLSLTLSTGDNSMWSTWLFPERDEVYRRGPVTANDRLDIRNVRLRWYFRDARFLASRYSRWDVLTLLLLEEGNKREMRMREKKARAQPEINGRGGPGGGESL